MKRHPEARGGTRAITSLQNERVKLIRSLEMRKARRETGLFVAEGASVLISARDAGWKPKLLVFLAPGAATGLHRDLVGWAQAAGAECLEVSEPVLAKLAGKDNPQTMLAVFEQRWQSEPAPDALPRDALWVALAMLLIVEGILPFLAPRFWRDTFRKIIELSDGQLRFIGLISIALGVVGLMLLQYA